MVRKVLYLFAATGFLIVVQLAFMNHSFLPNFSFFIKDEIIQIPLLSDENEDSPALFHVQEKEGAAHHSNADSIVLLPSEHLIHSSDFENDLQFFYRKLMKLNEDSSLVRILHFGDSQIEGDRVTGILRSSFQERFGGSGIGYIPVSENHVSRLNVNRKVSGWNAYRIFGGAQSAPHNSFGFEGYFHRPKPGEEESEIILSPAVKYYSKADKYKNLKVLYASDANDTIFRLEKGGQQIKNRKMTQVGLVKQLSFQITDQSSDQVKLFCSSSDTVDVFAIGLDGNTGVAVDNIAMRGSSGIEFTKMNEKVLKNQFDLMNVGLIIYQFGINVIPYVVEDYTFYENLIYRQLTLFKRLVPGVSILVVGVSDMSMKEGDLYTSYPNIAAIKKAQKQAAKRAGCAFWDLQEVMGGENAMLDWVYAKPPLAEKDFTHFNRNGAKKIGKKLAMALLFDYQQFLKMPTY